MDFAARKLAVLAPAFRDTAILARFRRLDQPGRLHYLRPVNLWKRTSHSPVARPRDDDGSSMFKTSSYKERFKGQLRMEVFNLTNTPYFYAPGADGSNTGNEVGSAQFGQISLQANFPRVFQVGVRLMF